MGRSGDETRARILAAAYGQFYREGFARVSMDAIAAAAGVTKRTLYHHFESKDALLAAVLHQQSEHALALFRRMGTRAATQADLLEVVFGGIGRWAAKRGWLGSGYTRLTMELADMPGHPARAVARRHKRELEDWVTSELARMGCGRPEELARQVIILMEGCMCLVLIHGDRSYAAAAGRAAARLAADDWSAAETAGDQPAAGEGALGTP
jgi:AcrR family transcriptional regulator